MPAPRNRRHILVSKSPQSDPYTSQRTMRSKEAPPPAIGRAAHGSSLVSAIRTAELAAQTRRANAGYAIHGARPGIYLEFESPPGIPLSLHTLENHPQGIEIVAVTHGSTSTTSTSIERAVVFVPDGKIDHFVKRFEKYALTTPKQFREIRHEDMVDRIARLRLATLRALWTDEDSAYPNDAQSIWFEVWLRRTDGRELDRILEFATQSQLKLKDRRLELDDTVIVLVYASPNQLSSSLDVLSDVAEIRRAKELATFFVDQRSEEQSAWAKDVTRRTTSPANDAPAVTILDTGVTRAHPLLECALALEEMHAVEPSWGTHDDGGGNTMMGHGTEMAGLALYGDLAPVLASQDEVELHHRLESVKLLPPSKFGPNEPELYGAVTATAVSYPEIQAASRKRVFAMAVSGDDMRDRGQPSSWSAALDALSCGRMFDATSGGLVYLDDGVRSEGRLFVVSAGNVSRMDPAHLERSDLEPIQDPAQAWNVLTVGACTDRATLDDPRWQTWQPLAKPGDLSPFSTTSVSFAAPWPLKPDVVAEGGNCVVNGKGDVDFPVGDLSLLTTHYKPTERQFVLTWATSAACAQVARLCAKVLAEYPQFWAETVRALIVHSAQWTSEMQKQFDVSEKKGARLKLVRRYGFGVPKESRALRSANDALTLVSQGTIRPFDKGTLREMHLVELPWPKAALEALGETPVKLRVTLSYFVEPNPARRGWQRKHRYQSHGLRFEVKGALESNEDFRKRLNKRALEEDEERPTIESDDGWYLGDQARKRGSIHSDVWEGTSADLAARGVLAVFPVTGWWKEQKKRDRSERGVRYSLVVSIETPDTNVDIWTPVAQEVMTPLEVLVEL